MPNIIRQS